MKISDDTLRKIHDTSIVTVADKLGMKLYGMGDENRKACCPYHEDQHLPLHFSTKRGCSKDGGVIFWEIDDQQRVHTGKIMYYQSDCHRDKSHNPTWVHTLMKSHLPANYELQHCLFGLHLLNSHPDPLMGRGYLNERATGGAVKPFTL